MILTAELKKTVLDAQAIKEKVLKTPYVELVKLGLERRREFHMPLRISQLLDPTRGTITGVGYPNNYHSQLGQGPSATVVDLIVDGVEKKVEDTVKETIIPQVESEIKVERSTLEAQIPENEEQLKTLQEEILSLNSQKQNLEEQRSQQSAVIEKYQVTINTVSQRITALFQTISTAIEGTDVHNRLDISLMDAKPTIEKTKAKILKETVVNEENVAYKNFDATIAKLIQEDLDKNPSDEKQEFLPTGTTVRDTLYGQVDGIIGENCEYHDLVSLINMVPTSNVQISLKKQLTAFEKIKSEKDLSLAYRSLYKRVLVYFGLTHWDESKKIGGSTKQVDHISRIRKLSIPSLIEQVYRAENEEYRRSRNAYDKITGQQKSIDQQYEEKRKQKEATDKLLKTSQTRLREISDESYSSQEAARRSFLKVEELFGINFSSKEVKDLITEVITSLPSDVRDTIHALLVDELAKGLLQNDSGGNDLLRGILQKALKRSLDTKYFNEYQNRDYLGISSLQNMVYLIQQEGKQFRMIDRSGFIELYNSLTNDTSNNRERGLEVTRKFMARLLGNHEKVEMTLFHPVIVYGADNNDKNQAFTYSSVKVSVEKGGMVKIGSKSFPSIEKAFEHIVSERNDPSGRTFFFGQEGSGSLDREDSVTGLNRSQGMRSFFAVVTEAT